MREKPCKKNGTGKKNICHIMVVYLTIATATLFCSALLYTQVLMNAYIPSESMEPALMTGDRIIGNRLAYRFGAAPERLDIVLFYATDDGTLYVKRVIGIPGDTVEIQGDRVYVNGELLDEPYAQYTANGTESGEWAEKHTFRIPEGHYFMLGDNRDNSWDSRYWSNPYVPESRIVAKAVFKYWKGFRLFG